ncbi:hypothetical protein SeLEV6574_g03964 [Synchytrium endobioticum]|uniref:RING-type domain-containing protein n=1 Tax=Synchytrium endobioticum TaxID=286115 RepID=A0A507D1Y2_9FUNG|nr:hypothetical protein SeLEV6574_g03964 [Synchytrium endobioticum]
MGGLLSRSHSGVPAMNRTKVIALVILQLTACPINGVTAWPGDDLVRSGGASQRRTSPYSPGYEQGRRRAQRAQNIEHAFAGRPNPSIMTYEPQDGMHAHRQEEDAGTSYHNTMAQSRFNTVSRTIVRMLNEANEIVAPLNLTDPLRVIVANLQSMWTTIKSHSGDMSQALDAFVQELFNSKMNHGVYSQSRPHLEEFRLRVVQALGLGYDGLNSHLSVWGSWEDPECSECGGILSVRDRRKLSCHHFVHRECSSRSRQPCARCVAEAGQDS